MNAIDAHTITETLLKLAAKVAALETIIVENDLATDEGVHQLYEQRLTEMRGMMKSSR